MSANAWLILFIVAFWALVWGAIRVHHLLHRRPLSDGPSLIPVIPIVPLASFGVGWILNWLHPPAGTGVVVLLHLGSLTFAAIAVCWRSRGGK